MSSSEGDFVASSPSKSRRYSDKRSEKGKDPHAEKETYKEKEKFKDKTKDDETLTRERVEKEKADKEKSDFVGKRKDTGIAKKKGKLATPKALELFRAKKISEKAEEEKRETLKREKVKADKFALFIADKEEKERIARE